MNVTLHALHLPPTLTEVWGKIDWQQRDVTVFGKTYPQPRLTKWYGEVPYRYSGLSWEAAPLPALLESIRTQIEHITGERFNSCLCNLYRGGSDCVGWHADDEPLFGGDPVVASVSFGATRVFKLRRNDKSEMCDFKLTDGSLLVMGRGIQRDWKHTLPRTSQPCGPRVNLTFRLTV